jgi:hypothetical protein
MDSQSATPSGAAEILRLIRWPVAAVAVSAMVLGLVWWTMWRIETRAEHAAAATGRTLQEAAEALRTTTITETFQAAIPRLVPEGLELQVAVLEATERLERRDSRRAMFDLVPLGTAVSEIRVPVTYRYGVDLEAPWELVVADGVCRVTAPAPHPQLPPAFDTARTEKRVEGSWLRFDEQEVMDALERSLTTRLSSRAGHPDRLGLIRETARARVEVFVREWLLAEQRWGDGGVVAVEVRFADEPIDRAAMDFVLTIPD